MRAVLSHILALLLSTGALVSSAAPQVLNLPTTSFEGDPVGSLPTGWHVPQGMAALGFRAQIELDPLEQTRALRLTASASEGAFGRGPGWSSGASNRSRLGSVLYSLDAAAYQGRNLHFSTRARLVPSSSDSQYPDDRVSRRRSRATAWMRFDRSTGPPLFFEQGDIDARLGWQTIGIEAAVPAGTEQIHLGLTLYGDGEAWVDDVRLTDTGASGHEPARNLTDLGRQNLIALTKLYGTVRFFHPSDEASSTDWNRFLYGVIDFLEAATDEVDRAARLQTAFDPVAPTMHISSVAGPIFSSNTHDLQLGAPQPDRVLIWDHYGLGTGRDDTYSSERRADETLSVSGFPTPLNTFRVDLGSTIYADVPLAVYADTNGTLPRAAITPTRMWQTPADFLPSYHDRTTRIAAVIVLWNVIEHFFPYFDETNSLWSEHLILMLDAASKIDDRDEFLAALQRSVATLGDGHANVYPFYDLKTGRLPVTWQWLEGALIVTGAAPTSLRRGDRIVAIDGLPVENALTTIEERISSPTFRWKRQRALDQLREGQIGDKLRLVFERVDGSLAEIEVEYWSRSRERSWKARTGLPVFHRWTDGMVYIDAGRCTDLQMREWILQLAGARGLIIDMRGYPKGLSPTFLEHIVDKPTRSLQWHVPVTRAPHQLETYVSSSNWTIRPRTPRISCPVALLQDERAISRSETYLALFKESGAGRTFGSPTAGTNGNSNVVILPGDFRIMFTGMEVRQPGGDLFHGVGVAPDVFVRPSRQNVRAGRDQVLEAARSWIRTERPGKGTQTFRRR